MEVIEFFEYIKTPTTVVHVVGVIIGMGSALVSDILFSFFSKDKNLNTTEMRTLLILKDIVFYNLILIVFSGSIIFFTNIEGYLGSVKFMAKMSILLVLLINGYVLNKYILPHLLNKNFFKSKKEKTIRKLAFVCGAVSVISWLFVATLGVLDNINMSYSLIISGYLFVVFLGTSVSLMIEKKEFN